MGFLLRVPDSTGAMAGMIRQRFGTGQGTGRPLGLLRAPIGRRKMIAVNGKMFSRKIFP
jgi:hypothetical protein